MRWTLFAASAAIAATLWLPGEAAQPAPPAAATGDPITFEQYRDWRLAFIERRQNALAVELAAADLPAQRKARLEQVKAYYDGDIALDIPYSLIMICPVREIGHGKPGSQPHSVS
jgi:hypothetical protein